MANHYIQRFDLSKYTLKSFDGVNEICADTNASDQLTYNANGSTKVLVDTTSVQTLTNKTISGATLTTDTIADPTDPTKKIAFDLASASTATTLTLKDQQTTSQTLSVPNLTGADTVLTVNATQSGIVGKTFTAPVLGAATATSINKVALTAPATSATITIPDGVTVTGPAASDTLVGRTSTDTLTNKTLTGNINADTVFCTTQFDATSGTTGTTLTNVVGLVTTVVAGTYQYEVNLSGTSTSNSGTKFAFHYVTTALTSLEAASQGFTAAAVAVQHTTTSTDQALLHDNAAAVIYTRIVGRMVVSTGGTVQLQAAQHASHADTTSVFVGSSMRFTRVA